MTRATEAYTVGAILIATYIVLYLGLIPLPEIVQEKIIPVVIFFLDDPTRLTSSNPLFLLLASLVGSCHFRKLLSFEYRFRNVHFP